VAFTSASGAFAFENVPELSGTLTILASGFQQKVQGWSGSPGTPAHLEIILAPLPVNQRIVVTAARTGTLFSDVPMSDTQLTRDDLEATPALKLDDALRQVPGFSLFRRSSSRTANPTTQGVSLRGLGASGASRALVLEDGIPLNDPFGGWVYWDRVPDKSVASVEVAQEGASSLYGSDALGGVIQFLTRPANPSGLYLETSYGSQNSPDVSLWAGGQKGRWESTFSGGSFHTNGYILVPGSNRGNVDTKAGVSDGAADLMVGRKIGAQSEVFARGWYFDEARRNGTPFQTNDTRLAQGALGANLGLGRIGSLTLRFYGDAQTFHQNFSAIAPGRNTESLTDMQTVPAQGVGGSVLWSHAIGKRQTVVAGFDDHEEIGHSDERIFSAGTLARNTFSGGRQRTLGVFAEDLIQLAPRWLLEASARFDHWRNFDASSLCSPASSPCPGPNTFFADRADNAFSPRLILVHQINANVSWDASVYRAFRAPTLNELYRSFRQGNVLTEANADLVAEHLTGGESGVGVNGFNHRLEIRGTFFFNEIINPVANVTLKTTPTLITRQRKNLGRTRAPGFDIGATAHIANQFQLSAGYQFVAATVDSFPANAALVGLWIPQVPRHVLTFQARYSNPSLMNVTVDGRMVGKQFDDDQNQFPLGRFFVLDAMASRGLGSGVELFAAVENLLNEKYATAATPVPQLGLPIAARFGLRFQFPRR
jgi:outer membrane receptor protein involved in Fe transport